eukprot:COSAG03_NODE_2786_length_2453_cov_38.126168_2_plen_39_part_00
MAVKLVRMNMARRLRQRCNSGIPSSNPAAPAAKLVDCQ